MPARLMKISCLLVLDVLIKIQQINGENHTQKAHTYTHTHIDSVLLFCIISWYIYILHIDSMMFEFSVNI